MISIISHLVHTFLSLSKLSLKIKANCLSDYPSVNNPGHFNYLSVRVTVTTVYDGDIVYESLQLPERGLYDGYLHSVGISPAP